MNTKRQFKCNTDSCGYITDKRMEITKHIRTSKHRDGVSVNDYVWQEDKQVFGIMISLLSAILITALVLGVSS